ncbi:multidrug transporter [Pontibacter sp. H249]|uniref:multidrug transporter n=1 Tax=Pontibacter sp. H249 TaxID=3133420 RepID=UPI0030BF65FD
MEQPSTTTYPTASTNGFQTLKLSATSIAKGLMAVVLLLLCLHITGVLLEAVFDYDSRLTRIIVRYFDFNGEENVPAFFSSVLLLTAAALLYLIYLVHKKSMKSGSGKRYWLVLSFIFAFMAVDESVQIHEHIAEFVRPQLTSDLNGLLHWSWVVPYSFALIAIVAFFFKWVLSLPTVARNLFFIAGAMFVMGALGLEFVEGYLYKHYGLNHIYNRVMYTLEEFLEMTAVILFIYALLQHLASFKQKILLTKANL